MKHRIGLTVTDPNHPMVSKRKETIQKTVRVTGDDKEKAINSAIAHYKRKGYKVHDHHYIGTVQEGYGRNRGYAHGFASPHAPSLGGPRHREDDEGWDREPKQADVPHAVHINGKKWKSFSSQSHAQNVAKKIKGATVHKEDVDLDEGYKVHDHHYIGSVNEEIMSVADTYKKLAVKHMKDKHKAETEKQRRYAHTMHLRALQAAKMDNHTDALNHYRGVKEDADMVEGLQQTLRKVVPGYAKKQIDQKMDAGKFGKTDADKDANFHRYKKIQDKLNKEEVEIDEADAFPINHNGQSAKSQVKSTRQSAETKAKSIATQAVNKSKTDAAMKEDIQIVDEAWNQGNRNPQKGIKVGHKVRSYDFPGMHDDHYVEGHVVGETPHSYHIRVNKVVRGGKEIPTPTHMSHVEAPKGKGMFSNAYGVHKIMAKQEDAAAAPEPAKGGAKTFANVRGKKK